MCGLLMKAVGHSQLLNTLAVAWSKRGFSVHNRVKPKQWHAEIEAAKPAEAGAFSASPVRVLIAEDNPVNQKVTSLMLEKIGLRADVAGNGREAVEMFDMLPYEMIRVDCQLPETNAHETTAALLHRHRSHCLLHIIAMHPDTLTPNNN